MPCDVIGARNDKLIPSADAVDDGRGVGVWGFRFRIGRAVLPPVDFPCRRIEGNDVGRIVRFVTVKDFYDQISPVKKGEEA